MVSKKGQGLSLGFVIVAALGLIVLVIIAIIVSRNFRQFGEDSESVRKEFGINACEIPGSGRVCSIGRVCPAGYEHTQALTRYDGSCNTGDAINNYCCEK